MSQPDYQKFLVFATSNTIKTYIDVALGSKAARGTRLVQPLFCLCRSRIEFLRSAHGTATFICKNCKDLRQQPPPHRYIEEDLKWITNGNDSEAWSIKTLQFPTEDIQKLVWTTVGRETYTTFAPMTADEVYRYNLKALGIKEPYT